MTQSSKPGPAILLPGNGDLDRNVMINMKGWGGRWQTVVYPLPSGGFAYEHGASKLEHMAVEFMAAEIAGVESGQRPTPADEDMAERAVKRAVAILNVLSRTEVQAKSAPAPGKVPESVQAPPRGAN